VRKKKAHAGVSHMEGEIPCHRHGIPLKTPISDKLDAGTATLPSRTRRRVPGKSGLTCLNQLAIRHLLAEGADGSLKCALRGCSLAVLASLFPGGHIRCPGIWPGASSPLKMCCHGGGDPMQMKQFFTNLRRAFNGLPRHRNWCDDNFRQIYVSRDLQLRWVDIITRRIDLVLVMRQSPR
jgi:hypothetical protein